MNTELSEIGPPPSFVPRCLSIDLEVGRRDERIHQFAAVRGDTGEVFAFNKGNLVAALRQLGSPGLGLAVPSSVESMRRLNLFHQLVDFSTVVGAPSQ